MIKIKTLFFGITKDLVNTSEQIISVDKNTSVKIFKEILQEKYPQLTNVNTYSIAVNETYANNEQILKNDDVLAVIPPVSGG